MRDTCVTTEATGRVMPKGGSVSEGVLKNGVLRTISLASGAVTEGLRKVTGTYREQKARAASERRRFCTQMIRWTTESM